MITTFYERELRCCPGNQVEMGRRELISSVRKNLCEIQGIEAYEQRRFNMVSSILPSLIRRELIGLEQLVAVCVKRHARRSELVGVGAEDILADSLATCLHSFYTGLERLFEAIVRESDGARAQPPEWHCELLMTVSVERPGVRPSIICEATFRRLDEYRAFRHLFCHLYAHHIDSKRIFDLLETLESTWKLVRDDMVGFAAFLEAADAR